MTPGLRPRLLNPQQSPGFGAEPDGRDGRQSWRRGEGQKWPSLLAPARSPTAEKRARSLDRLAAVEGLEGVEGALDVVGLHDREALALHPLQVLLGHSQDARELVR